MTFARAGAMAIFVSAGAVGAQHAELNHGEAAATLQILAAVAVATAVGIVLVSSASPH